MSTVAIPVIQKVTMNNAGHLKVSRNRDWTCNQRNTSVTFSIHSYESRLNVKNNSCKE